MSTLGYKVDILDHVLSMKGNPFVHPLVNFFEMNGWESMWFSFPLNLSNCML